MKTWQKAALAGIPAICVLAETQGCARTTPEQSYEEMMNGGRRMEEIQSMQAESRMNAEPSFVREGMAQDVKAIQDQGGLGTNVNIIGNPYITPSNQYDR